MKRYVLTGGPGVGKSTMIELLSQQGYVVVPEAARIVIDREQAKGSDVLPWKDLETFQKVVAELQFELEEAARGDIIFQDRSVVDGAGYALHGRVAVPSLVEQVARGRYDAIFLLDPLPTYVTDGARKESEEDRALLHLAIRDAYVAFGYKPVSLPVLPPEERVRHVLSTVSS